MVLLEQIHFGVNFWSTDVFNPFMRDAKKDLLSEIIVEHL